MIQIVYKYSVIAAIMDIKNLEMESKLYIDGKFKESSEKLNVLNPYNQEELVQVSLGGESDVEEAVKSAQAAFDECKKLKTYEKSQALEFISDELLRQKERLATILSLESGKPITQAEVEIVRGAQTFKLASEFINHDHGEVIPLDILESSGERFGIVKNFPVGIVYGISPFNFPLNLVAHKVAPAIAAGCPIILKPASETPITSLELAKIFDKTHLPKAMFQVLPMTRQVGDLLIEDERIHMLSFTGSPGVGWKLKSRAGKKKVVLELGGDAAIYAHSDCDVDEVVGKAIIGSFANAGQICISVQRLIVHSSIYEEFKTKFLEKVQSIVAGDPLNRETLMGPLINLKNKDRILEWMQEAQDKGAIKLCGGEVVDESIITPIVFEAPEKGLNITEEEIFGPIVNLYKVSSKQEAIDMINSSQFGLQCGIFTNDNEFIFDCFEQIDCAGVVINDFPTFRVDNMPYGGVKESGFGREGIKYAIKDMSEEKLLVMNRTNRYEK